MQARVHTHLERAPDPSRAPALRLLDGFELRQDCRAVAAPRSVQRLLAFLALQSRPVLRLYVAGCLWLDSDEAHANASLRSALWRVQRIGGNLVTATGTHIALAPGVGTDIARAGLLARELIRRSSTPTTAQVDEICALGDLLPDWYDDWLVVERERLRQLRLHALDAACRHLARARRYAEAVEVGLTAVAAEPLRESAHRALIEAHVAEGNLGEAARQLEAYRRLAARLGVEPSPGLERVVTLASARRARAV